MTEPDFCQSHDLSHFLQAIRQFKDRFYDHQPEIMHTLVEQGQHPKVLLIGCSDSRVDPALLMGARPGDLFVVRNVANLVPPYQGGGHYDSAGSAIEYAVRDLGVSHIIVMGHARCGGIKALLNIESGERVEREFIGNWVSIAHDACHIEIPDGQSPQGKRKVSLEQLHTYPYLVERAAILNTLQNLRSYPWVKTAIEQQRLKLHGWWFDLESGDLWITDSESTAFMPLAD